MANLKVRAITGLTKDGKKFDEIDHKEIIASERVKLVEKDSKQNEKDGMIV